MEQLATPDSEVQVTPETPESQPIFEGHDEDQAQAETLELEVVDDSEEVDYDGEKYKVPKKLKDAFLRQQDYTVKTQALAEQHRAFEAQQQQFEAQRQFQTQYLDAVSEVRAIDRQLSQFQKLDWNALTDADPVQALKLDRQMRELQQQRTQQVQSIEQAQARNQFESSQATARQLEEAKAQLAREIKGFGTPEVMKALTDVGRDMGFKPEELAQVKDPRAIKLLHEAYLYRQLVAKQKTAAPASEAIKPITRVSGASATNTKSLGDPGLSDAEYNRMRREWIKKNR